LTEYSVETADFLLAAFVAEFSDLLRPASVINERQNGSAFPQARSDHRPYPAAASTTVAWCPDASPSRSRLAIGTAEHTGDVAARPKRANPATKEKHRAQHR
jgi:hypothetical protein